MSVVNIHQGHLEGIVQALFPGKNIITNVRKDALIKNPTTGSYFEIDVWVPDVQLCFEFQDPYHFTASWEAYTPLHNIQQRDDLKREKSLEKDNTLIMIPCWWDGSNESLKATVSFQRPDMFNNESDGFDIIPLNPPPSFFKPGVVPDVGELMLASFPKSTHFISSISDSNPWWMGEKYDGIRCCWNPIRFKLYTRTGLALNIPSSFLNHFPNTFLDSEIWFGRGQFHDSQKMIMYTSEHSINWPHLRVMTFDVPMLHESASETETPFEIRYTHLLDSTYRTHPFIITASRREVKRKKELISTTHHVINDGGEGVILRKPHSEYYHGRSTQLLKFKATRGDTEALVTNIAEDLTVHLTTPSGTHFTVPPPTPTSPNSFSFSKGNNKLEVGQIVTFTYDSMSRQLGTPINPKIIRVRTDLSWRDVVRNHSENTTAATPHSLNEPSRKAIGFTSQPVGHWLALKGRNMKEFFEKVAKHLNFSPHSPIGWYTVSRDYILSLKGAKSILGHFKGSLVRALMYLFPDIGLEESKFEFLPRHYWSNIKNRRRLLYSFAKENNFNPLKPANWYSIPRAKFLSYPNAKTMITYYKGSWSSALLHLFPDIGIDRTKFAALPISFYKDVDNRKKVFDLFATAKGFDPLVVQNWHSVTLEELLEFKGGRIVLYYYRGNLPRALSRLYPSLSDIDATKFSIPPERFWLDKTNGRLLFSSFAKAFNFNPLVPDTWYNITKKQILSYKGMKNVLVNYNWNVANALVHLFPEVDFDSTQFYNHPQNYWKHADNQREFFEEFAKANDFNPLVASNWYNIPRVKILETEGAASMLRYFDGSYVRALQNLFPAIKFDENKFVGLRDKYINSKSNRRKAILRFAAEKGLSVDQPSDWYTVENREIKAINGGKDLLQYYKGNLHDCMADLFPKLKLDKSLFISELKNDWSSLSNRRKLFENFANTKGFDPLISSNWYSVPSNLIFNFKGGRTVLSSYYKNRFVKAVQHVFPEIHFDEHRFSKDSFKVW